ncbi:uncharacterized protein LOC106473075, partial [Limulus polyphemus]|uniref:Uncharacterized protein LOC106473075 n=1 Tax=Limulus polyphemus TaxID=6850 RepID=A0ABM1BV11_LIMPO
YELKNELARKEQLLQKYNEKISYWQSLVAEVSASPRLSHHPVPPPTQQMQGISQPVPPQHQGASPVTHPHQMTSHQLPLQHPPPNIHPGMVQQQGMVTHPSQMPQGGQFGDPQQHQGGLQGPLAYLERTTSNIGMPITIIRYRSYSFFKRNFFFQHRSQNSLLLR